MHPNAHAFGRGALRLTKKKIAILCCTSILLSLCTGFSFRSRQNPVITTKTIVRTEQIPFDTTYIDLPQYFVGYEKQVSAGTYGERRIEAQVVTVGGVVTQVLSISSRVTAEPVNAVVNRGAKTIRTATVSGSWKTTFIRPLNTGWISADFYDYPGHNGVDFAAPKGTAVLASAGGTVTLASYWGEYGYCVIIDHGGGISTLYAHNSALTVSKGQTVRQGQTIAKVGTTGNSTGNHLHFEIRTSSGFLDPLVYIGKTLS